LVRAALLELLLISEEILEVIAYLVLILQLVVALAAQVAVMVLLARVVQAAAVRLVQEVHQVALEHQDKVLQVEILTAVMLAAVVVVALAA
jgi:hypothetical protein